MIQKKNLVLTNPHYININASKPKTDNSKNLLKSHKIQVILVVYKYIELKNIAILIM